MEQACANWASNNTADLDFSQQICQAGSHLVEMIQGHKLSHAEVNLIIVSTRQSGCKWQMRDAHALLTRQANATGNRYFSAADCFAHLSP